MSAPKFRTVVLPKRNPQVRVSPRPKSKYSSAVHCMCKSINQFQRTPNYSNLFPSCDNIFLFSPRGSALQPTLHHGSYSPALASYATAKATSTRTQPILFSLPAVRFDLLSSWRTYKGPISAGWLPRVWMSLPLCCCDEGLLSMPSPTVPPCHHAFP